MSWNYRFETARRKPYNLGKRSVKLALWPLDFGEARMICGHASTDAGGSLLQRTNSVNKKILSYIQE